VFTAGVKTQRWQARANQGSLFLFRESIKLRVFAVQQLEVEGLHAREIRILRRSVNHALSLWAKGGQLKAADLNNPHGASR
jgi:hypothetical protein